MRTIVFFMLCIVLGFSPVFAQSTPVTVYPIANGFTVSFTLPSYTLRDTTLTEIFSTNDVRLYDGQGNMLHQQRSKGGTVLFNVSNLPEGFYYLHIYDDAGSNPIMETIVAEH